MLKSNYQRVGALAGLLMFLGAWLTSYYGHWAWALLTTIAVVGAFWLALDGDVEEDLNKRVLKGFKLGLIIALVSRILGMFTMAWAYDSWTVATTEKYSRISDLFRVLFNGKFVASLVAIVGIAVAGAFIAYAMPYFVAEKEEE